MTSSSKGVHAKMQPAGPGWFYYHELKGPQPRTERPIQLRSIGHVEVSGAEHTGKFVLWACDEDGSYWATRAEPVA